MIDVSKKEFKIKLDNFRDMMVRFTAYSITKGEPKTIAIDDKNFINNAKFKDMVKRYNAFKTKYSKEPSIIWTNKPNTVKITVPPVQNNWVSVKSFAQDFQNTDHTCADSSMQMAFSTYGVKVDEMWLAQVAGTTEAGTSHPQIFKAVKKVSEKTGILFKANHYTLNEMGGWQGVSDSIKNGKTTILHIRTGSLTVDANGQTCWLHDYGHYVFLVGVNIKEGKVRIADPTKGIREFTFAQIQRAISAVSQPSFVVIMKG